MGVHLPERQMGGPHRGDHKAKNPQSTDHTSQHPQHSHHSEHPTAQLPQHSPHSTTATTTTQEQRNAEQPQHHQAPSSQTGLDGRPSAISGAASHGLALGL